jgi:hypothetical protein
MRIIQSADWQIGKVFKQFGTKEESLRQARLAEAAETALSGKGWLPSILKASAA